MRDGPVGPEKSDSWVVGTAVDVALRVKPINYLCREGGRVKMRLKGQSPKCQKRQKANDKCAH